MQQQQPGGTGGARSGAGGGAAAPAGAVAMLIGEIITVAFSVHPGQQAPVAAHHAGHHHRRRRRHHHGRARVGAQKAVQDRIASLGANLFSVYPGQASTGGVRSPPHRPQHRRLRGARARRHATERRCPGDAAAHAGAVRQPEHQRQCRRVRPRTTPVRNYTVTARADVHRRRRRGPPALRRARRVRSHDAQRQPRRDDRPDDPRSAAFRSTSSASCARRGQQAASPIPTSRSSSRCRPRATACSAPTGCAIRSRCRTACR